MKSKIFAKIQKLFLLGGKKRNSGAKQSEVQPEEEKELIDSLNLPEDNPWYFAGEKSKEANFLTKLHFSSGPRLMQKEANRSRWAWNSTEQSYRPQAAGPIGSVEVWNEHCHLGTEEGVPIEIQMLQEHESKLKHSKMAQAMYSDTDPSMSIMTQEVPTESETMELPPGIVMLADDGESPPAT